MLLSKRVPANKKGLCFLPFQHKILWKLSLEDIFVKKRCSYDWFPKYSPNVIIPAYLFPAQDMERCNILLQIIYGQSQLKCIKLQSKWISNYKHRFIYPILTSIVEVRPSTNNHIQKFYQILMGNNSTDISEVKRDIEFYIISSNIFTFIALYFV